LWKGGQFRLSVKIGNSDKKEN